MTSPITRRQVLAGTAAALVAPSLRAQGAWPSKPVTVVVPFPPGGGTDAFARPLFALMTKNVGRQFIIDNKGGAGGTLGAGLASRAAPDGHSFFMGAVHHAIAPSMYPKLDYNIETDFVPVGLVSSVPQVIVVNPTRVQATTLPQLLDYLRKNPGRLNYGSAGNGTSHHLAGELFKLQTRTFITHIPYRGAGPMLQDLIAGQVDMAFDGLGSSAAHIKGGRLRGIAVAADHRAPGFADLPTGGRRRRADVQGRHLVRHLGAQGHAARRHPGDGRRNAQGAEQRRDEDDVDRTGHRHAQLVGR
jgi:tripartite-type tricarboxylate transporter receptor subunit TctC